MSMEETKEQQDNFENESNATEEADHLLNEKLQCRYYRKDFPEEGDLVIVLFSLTLPRLKPQKFTRMELM